MMSRSSACIAGLASIVALLVVVSSGGCDDTVRGQRRLDARGVDVLPLVDGSVGADGAIDGRPSDGARDQRAADGGLDQAVDLSGDQQAPDGPQGLDGGRDQRADQGSACNDGVQQGDEDCDEGLLNSLLPDAPCRPDCTLPRCGDEVIDSDEQCDDGAGNGGAGAACSIDCRLTALAGLAADPAQLRFGAFGLGCDGPRTIDLRLVNPTTGSIELAAVETIDCGSEVQFPVSSVVTIGPGGSATVPVTFDPQQEGLVSCALRVRTTNPDAELRLPLTAQVSATATQIDRFVQQLNRRVDILMVVDPTGSMADERQRLVDTASAFFAAASAAQLDFHLGAISISPDSPGPLGLLFGDPPYVDAQTPDLEDEFAERLAMSDTSSTETGFDAVIAAVTPPLTAVIDAGSCGSCSWPDRCADGACVGRNHGFRRGDASLEVLAFSDEDDGSTTTVDELLDFLRQRVDPLIGSFVRIHAILPGALCPDPDPIPRWSAVIDATGGELHDLCAASYVAAVQGITDRSFGLQDHFPLSRTPQPGTLVVTVDGQGATGQSYDDQADALIFSPPPPDGARIEASYTPVCN